MESTGKRASSLPDRKLTSATSNALSAFELEVFGKERETGGKGTRRKEKKGGRREQVTSRLTPDETWKHKCHARNYDFNIAHGKQKHLHIIAWR